MKRTRITINKRIGSNLYSKSQIQRPKLTRTSGTQSNQFFSPLTHNFSVFVFKLGHFIAYEYFPHETNAQA